MTITAHISLAKVSTVTGCKYTKVCTGSKTPDSNQWMNNVHESMFTITSKLIHIVYKTQSPLLSTISFTAGCIISRHFVKKTVRQTCHITRAQM